jgi:hypothetical protein
LGCHELLRNARDIMRKDKSLNGDLDCLPLLTWIMFLKFLDDLLEKYAAEGALQFTLPDVLKVPPISKYGNVAEIAKLFGGFEQPGAAVNQVQSLLYAA